jgi:hypothetical protein
LANTFWSMLAIMPEPKSHSQGMTGLGSPLCGFPDPPD